VTIPRLLEMETYWSDHPPIHQMLAAFFGIKEKESSDVKAIEDSSAAFLRDFMAAGGSISAELQGELINV
jgi:hypothetical protein